MRSLLKPLQWAGMLLLILALWQCSTEPESVAPRPIQVLFLGHDSEHHNSAVYAPLLQRHLAPQGIYMTYTEDPDDLNADNLQGFDALILYANHDEVTTDQEEALLNFVDDGGAFLPIHSASYCFRNSDDVVDLIGGQFTSHDTATFEAVVVRPEHPALGGFTPFTSWDETYVHTNMAGDIEVLMERVEGDHHEPYTWVKEYGKGRVFYTALGHDERTWNKTEFLGLIEGGLLWAIGENKKQALDSLALPELTYSPAKIPNYEKRDPPPLLQAPLSPEQSMQRIQIPNGFRLELFASDPDIFNPISMAWDERGRLWILETKDYPNEIKSDYGIGSDRIKILEDTDGDGKADKFTVFADSLSVPTSLLFANGGVIVSQAPYFLFLKDTTGDDRADITEVIIEGWGTFDTHAGPSNLQYGFDNRIWGVLGYSGFEGKVGDESFEFRQGAYRFTPDGEKLEFMGSTSNNTWGLGFSEDFDVFISTANNTHSAFLGIPDRTFKGVEGLKVESVKKIDGHYSFHPNTANFRQVDVFGGFTAAAGHHLYTARNYPMEYWNRIALVCEPTGHLLHRSILEPEGAGYREVDGWNLLASSDEWVSPVHAQVGPDGAVWVIDWYNFIIQHNPTPEGFENGPGNAHVNPLRDRQHGRIYRLVHTEAENRATPDLSSTQGRIDALKHTNMLWRLHAQRLLVESGDLSVKDELLAMLANTDVDEIGLNTAAIHALWTLHGLDLINDENQDVIEAVAGALRHPSAAVRKNAVRVLAPTESNYRLLLRNRMFADEDPGTRLASIIMVGDLNNVAGVGELLYRLSQDNMVQQDEWLSRAVYAVAVQHKDAYVRALYNANAKKVAAGYQDEQVEVDWSGEDLDDSDWKSIKVPSRWNETGIPLFTNFDGVIWTRTTFSVDGLTGNRVMLHLGPIDDTDETYLNGQLIGATERDWNGTRVYRVPAGLLKAGENVLAVRISDSGGRGGMYGQMDEVFLEVGSENVDLSGQWLYKVEEQFFPNRSVFAEGMSIEDLFLKNYGPEASRVTNSLADSGVEGRVIQLSTVPDQMRYDLEELTVTAGETIRFVFSNNDGMQHNFILGEPGSLEVIGTAADEMAQTPEGATREYVPEAEGVIMFTGLVDPGDTVELVWEVPAEPGEYIYVCTFPGHWRTMNGTISVIAETL